MKITLDFENIIVEVNNKTFKLPKFHLYDHIMNGEILGEIDFKDIPQLFVFGIPNNLKEYLLKKVSLYDSSSAVNAFIYNNEEYWLDKATRVGLMNFLNCTDEDTCTFVLGESVITAPIDFAKNFLAKLEVYAQKCYLVTCLHIKAINALESNEDILNYDYTTGYPEKITLQ